MHQFSNFAPTTTTLLNFLRSPFYMNRRLISLKERKKESYMLRGNGMIIFFALPFFSTQLEFFTCANMNRSRVRLPTFFLEPFHMRLLLAVANREWTHLPTFAPLSPRGFCIRPLLDRRCSTIMFTMRFDMRPCFLLIRIGCLHCLPVLPSVSIAETWY